MRGPVPFARYPGSGLALLFRDRGRSAGRGPSRLFASGPGALRSGNRSTMVLRPMTRSYQAEDAAELVMSTTTRCLPWSARRRRAKEGAAVPRGGHERREATLRRARPTTRLFDGCDVGRRAHARQPADAPVPLEGRAAAAAWRRRPAHRLGQHRRPHHDARHPGRPLGLDPAAVRVVCPDVGGGFGAKIGGYPEELFVAWVARAARSPGPVGRDPQRVHARPWRTAGPSCRRHASAGPATAGARLPARHHPGRRRLSGASAPSCRC